MEPSEQQASEPGLIQEVCLVHGPADGLYDGDGTDLDAQDSDVDDEELFW